MDTQFSSHLLSEKIFAAYNKLQYTDRAVSEKVVVGVSATSQSVSMRWDKKRKDNQFD